MRPQQLCLLAAVMAAFALYRLPANALTTTLLVNAHYGGRPLDTYAQAPTTPELLAAGLSFVQASIATYENTSAARSRESARAHFTVRRFITRTNGTQVLFLVDNRALVIALRGTEPNMANDLVVDFAQIATQGWNAGIHPGWAGAAVSVYDDVLAEARTAVAEGKQIWLTGHSLGGALAQVLAYRLQGSVAIAGVHTFGSPAVGSTVWRTNYDRTLRNNTHRWVNLDDPIPCYPANPSQWQQAGRQHVLDGSNVFLDSAMTSCQDSLPTVTKICEPRSWWGTALYWLTGAAGICHISDASVAFLNLIDNLSTSEISMHKSANYRTRLTARLPGTVSSGLVMQ